MKITYILPAIGKKSQTKYIKTWKMEPLMIATLAALTPEEYEQEFFDDRIELIDYNTDTDLVAITLETYTALRGYDIAARFRERGIPVIGGGYHATLVPDEAARHVDSVVIGNAEPVWKQLLQDWRNGQLKEKYYGTTAFDDVVPDRRIFQNKKYLPISLIETGRGCPFTCEFCAITSYYDAKYHRRSIADIVTDIRNSGSKYFFFADDNIAANPGFTIELCKALEPLGIHWSGQGTLTAAKNPEMLKWMKRSGCFLLLIGFESLDEENLKQMGKEWSLQLGNRDDLVQGIHDHGISIYATFVFGFDNDTPKVFDQALDFSLKHDFFFAAFNHLLPFPGTPLYHRLQQEGRLLKKHWWLERDYYYGDISFMPKHMSPEQLSELCARARHDFFKFSSIFKRSLTLIQRNFFPALYFAYWMQNYNLYKEVEGKLGLPLGRGLDELPK